MGARRIGKKPARQLPAAPGWLTRRLLGGALLLASVGGGLGLGLWRLAQPDTLPIRQVQVQGEFRYLQRPALYAALGELTQGGFFTVDVRALKQAAESLPWVESASVRRVWPDTLRIGIQEQIPLARWQAGGMVNRHGALVPVADTGGLAGLPLFSGPQGTAKMLAERYQQLSQALSGIGLGVTTLELSQRRAWRVELNNGTHLLLGRALSAAQLARFTAAYQTVLAKRLGQIRSVDLRYTNGFAVRWKAGDGEAGLG